MNIKSLTIYCSSSNNLDPIYYEISKQMIHVIAKFDYSIVYGGGQVGIMGVVAKTSMELGLYVTGVVPKFLATKENMFKEINILKITKDMNQRKKILFELGDAFIAFPGGTGTIEEITEIISWKVLGLHQKPILFFNFQNFWNPLLEQFKSINENKFGNINLQSIFETIDTPQQFEKILKSWQK